jgi:hypothetical protein
MAQMELGDAELLGQIAQAKPETMRVLYCRYGRRV